MTTTFATAPYRPRVLLVVDALEPHEAALHTAELARYLASEIDFEFATVERGLGSLEADLRADGFPIHAVPRGLGFERRFRDLLSAQRYDAIHTHLDYAGGELLGYARREGVIDRIAHFHNAPPNAAPSIFARLRRTHHRHLVERNATQIIAVSDAVMRAVWGARWSDDARCVVVYDGVAPERFAPSPQRDALRATLGLERSAPLLMQVDELTPEHNQLATLDILALMRQTTPNARLVLVGAGASEYRQQLNARIDELGLRDAVELTECSEDAEHILPAADLVLVPSPHEELPAIALEASAAGLPVIAAASASVGEIARHLPNVIACSLQAGTNHWAELASGLVRCGASASIAARFRTSPFVLAATAELMRRVYTRPVVALNEEGEPVISE